MAKNEPKGIVSDFVKSIEASLHERASSPLFAAVAISWCLWNYRFFVVLFSELAVKEKLDYIERVLYGEWRTALIYLIGGPIFTALLFLFAYPYPAKKVFGFWRRKGKELTDLQHEIDSATLLTAEEGRRLRSMHFEMLAAHDEELQRKQLEVENAKQLVQAAEDKMGMLESQLQALKSRPSAALPRPVTNDDVLVSTLLRSPYRLYHNPAKGRGSSKTMVFGTNGAIAQGFNDNERSWRVNSGRLELIQQDGRVHSRFNLDPFTGVFTHTGESLLSAPGQFLIPEPDEEPPRAARVR